MELVGLESGADEMCGAIIMQIAINQGVSPVLIFEFWDCVAAEDYILVGVWLEPKCVGGTAVDGLEELELVVVDGAISVHAAGINHGQKEGIGGCILLAHSPSEGQHRVYGYQWFMQGEADGFGGGHADAEACIRAGPFGYGDSVEVAELAAYLLECIFDGEGKMRGVLLVIYFIDYQQFIVFAKGN